MATSSRQSLQIWPRRLLSGGAIVVGLLLCWWLASRWITKKAESSLSQMLAKSGLTASWEGTSLSPWNGIRFSKFNLRETSDEKRLIASTDNISVNAPLLQFIGIGQKTAEIHIRDSEVLVGDREGEILFERVSFSMQVTPKKFVIHQAEATHGGLTAVMTGDYLRRPKEPRPFSLNLSAVRAVLATLDFSGEGQSFQVKGTFHISPEKDRSVWNASVKGGGQHLLWKNIRLSKMEAAADLSSGESTIQISAETANAHAVAKLTKNGWHETPLAFRGELKDHEGNVDHFHGSYQERHLTVEKVSGSANLLQVARDLLPDHVDLPKQVNVSLFPEHQINNIRWSKEQSSEWTMESAKFHAQDFSVALPEDRSLKVSSLSGHISKTPDAWKFDEVEIQALTGQLRFSGQYDSGIFRETRISGNNLPLREIKQLLSPDSASTGKGRLSFEYIGSLHPQKKALFGTGSMALEDAPVLEVPLLDQVYELFIAVIPGIERSRTGKFEANFTAKSHIVEVSRFEATGGSLTVSARGIIDLQKEYVSGQARGKLLGLPGLVTKPLARLLEMNVGGPFDDIRVKPLGPTKLVSNAASGTVGVAVDTISEVGRVTETILKEGIRLPFSRPKQEKSEDEQDKPGVRRPAHRR